MRFNCDLLLCAVTDVGGAEEQEGGGAKDESGRSKGKKNAYSNSAQKMTCPYCPRVFPWASSLQRHMLTHTGNTHARTHAPFLCFCMNVLECTSTVTCKNHATADGAQVRQSICCSLFPSLMRELDT